MSQRSFVKALMLAVFPKFPLTAFTVHLLPRDDVNSTPITASALHLLQCWREVTSTVLPHCPHVTPVTVLARGDDKSGR